MSLSIKTSDEMSSMGEVVRVLISRGASVPTSIPTDGVPLVAGPDEVEHMEAFIQFLNRRAHERVYVAMKVNGSFGWRPLHECRQIVPRFNDDIIAFIEEGTVPAGPSALVTEEQATYFGTESELSMAPSNLTNSHCASFQHQDDRGRLRHLPF